MLLIFNILLPISANNGTHKSPLRDVTPLINLKPIWDLKKFSDSFLIHDSEDLQQEW